jgi:hydroxyethylthiazole kinase-like uncharacterized protein yjeF
MKVLSTEQIRLADSYTISHEPVLSLDLMERASEALAAGFGEYFDEAVPVTIIAGYGNNGGDGMALARLLAQRGREVTLFVVTPPLRRSPDAEANFRRLPKLPNLTVEAIGSDLPMPELVDGDVVVDALFGSGLTREPEGFMAELIDHINTSGALVVAVDIPSGLFGEDNRLNSREHIIRASLTLTFQFPKLAFFLRENHAYVGDWIVLEIGLHPDFIAGAETPWHLTDAETAGGWLLPRGKFDHKGSNGHALLVAGSTGKAGAAVLAASACLRSGAGLTTVAIPSGNNIILQTAVPEAMTIPGSDPGRITAIPAPGAFSAIGAGPGIGTHPDTGLALEKLLETCTVPLILDADAINLLALDPGSLLKVPKNSILTPHPVEFSRLFGDDPDDYSRLNRLRELASFYGLVIVLKGAHTAVAGTDGTVWFNSTGNPGMAKGGSGDVLTGIITALAARGYDPFTAARLGVYLHGLAGDIAAEECGQESLIAGDIVASIGQAFVRLHNNSI